MSPCESVTCKLAWNPIQFGWFYSGKSGLNFKPWSWALVRNGSLLRKWRFAPLVLPETSGP